MSYISMFCDEDLSREIDTARSDEEILLALEDEADRNDYQGE